MAWGPGDEDQAKVMPKAQPEKWQESNRLWCRGRSQGGLMLVKVARSPQNAD